MPTAKPIDPDALLASKRKSTGVGCSFAKMRAKLPPDLADAVTRWLDTDLSIHSAAAIADAISDFTEVYGLDFSTATTAQTVCRHHTASEFVRKCKGCQRAHS